MVLYYFCEDCQVKTPHAEDAVPDRESATVWHCLYCGKEHRPPGGNSKVLAQPPRV
jgi:hypothetical protein